MKTINQDTSNVKYYWLRIGAGNYGPFSDKVSALDMWRSMPDVTKERITYAALYQGSDNNPDKIVYTIR